MIRPCILIGSLVLVSICTLGSCNTLDLSKWQYRAELEFAPAEDGYARLTLTDEIYSAAAKNLADLRIADAQAAQIPYLLVHRRDTTRRTAYQPNIINRATDASGAAMVTLDFTDKVIKNTLEVITFGNDFRRFVSVEGSDDNIEFFALVGQAYVFAVDQRRRFEEVDLPDNDFRYLRVKVQPMPDEDEPPRIMTINALRLQRIKATRQDIDMTLVSEEVDPNTGASIFIYDLARNRLPIREIELDVADESFYRYVSVETRPSEKRKVEVRSEDNRKRFREVDVPWAALASRTIYRLDQADGDQRQQLHLTPKGADPRADRYLRITISNYDDKPLDISSITARAVYDQLVFPAADVQNAALYVGNDSAGEPQYDLEKRLTDPMEVVAAAVTVKPLGANPLFDDSAAESLAWTERHKGLLGAAMAAVVIIMAIVALASLRSIRKDDAATPHDG